MQNSYKYLLELKSDKPNYNIDIIIDKDLKNRKEPMTFEIAHSEFASIFCAYDQGVLCYLGFADNSDDARKSLEKVIPNREFMESDKAGAIDLLNIIRNKDTNTPIKVKLIGSDFQIKVWRELLNIPMGEFQTYSDIASAIGSENAVRAVASAIGANPVSIFIPCHRVIRLDGSLGGYMWGLENKRKLIDFETEEKS
jgi:AraC family transcriptional regulator of adaptative response/methylated-DNA-[protein]-cysteine methyltransferase